MRKYKNSYAIRCLCLFDWCIIPCTTAGKHAQVYDITPPQQVYLPHGGHSNCHPTTDHPHKNENEKPFFTAELKRHRAGARGSPINNDSALPSLTDGLRWQQLAQAAARAGYRSCAVRRTHYHQILVAAVNYAPGGGGGRYELQAPPTPPHKHSVGAFS